jgi:anthranilate synthase component 1
MKTRQEADYAFLLESMTGPRKLAQFSFIGYMPKLIVTAKSDKVFIRDTSSNETLRLQANEPLETLRHILGEGSPDNGFRFAGGAVGYISYDAVRYWEKLPNKAINDLEFPELQFGVYDDGVIFDHSSNQAFYFHGNEDRSSQIIELAGTRDDSGELSFSNPSANITKEQYEELVVKAKEHIAAGDIFQVVLSKRHRLTIKGDLAKFYFTLRRINPSPYMYFIKMGDQQIIGSSPEMLVRVDKGSVETFPIAGTRPRVEDASKNKTLASELLADPKERAEHIMLVDLARNDVGRISEYGSVQVPEFMQVHEYSHVQHIVSRVVGRLRRSCDAYDALRAVFPAGTVSGAPKVRAMEIIEESEPTRRGPYAGAVGYFSYNGNADFAITIRTLVAKGDRCFIQVGGGIVADSVPEREWFETEHKARALLKALEVAEGKS